MKPENRKLPIYKLKIDDTEGVDYIALVDHPAIEREWLCFNKEKAQFNIVDKDLMILTGPAMVADLPIYRRNEKMGEYFAVFDAETIEQIVLRYHKNKFTSNFNLMHDSNQKTDGVFMFESFIINRSRGIKPPKDFEGLTDGSWFVTLKVDNQELWDDFIKTGKLRGFSVEGEFGHEPFEEKKLSEIEQIVKVIEQLTD